MGYYKDTGSLQSMASAEAILKKRMPEKVGILPVAELLFVAESMWVGEHDMKGHFHPSFRFVKAKRYNAKPHVLIELDGETLADINGRSKYYEGFSRCVDRKPEEGAWIEPTEFGRRRGGGARIAIDRIDWQSGRRSSATADALTVGMAENVHKFLFRSSGWIR